MDTLERALRDADAAGAGFLSRAEMRRALPRSMVPNHVLADWIDIAGRAPDDRRRVNYLELVELARSLVEVDGLQRELQATYEEARSPSRGAGTESEMSLLGSPARSEGDDGPAVSWVDPMLAAPSAHDKRRAGWSCMRWACCCTGILVGIAAIVLIILFVEDDLPGQDKHHAAAHHGAPTTPPRFLHA